MTIEDRVRQVLNDAVADEPPLRGAPLQVASRRRRRRQVLAGVLAVVLVLAAVVALAAVRGRQRPVPTTDPASGWKLYTDTASNYQLRYPPDWVLRERQPGWIRIAPPEQAAGMLKDNPPFAVGVRAPAVGYYLGGQTGVDFTRGRLPSGQGYLVTGPEPDIQPPPGVQVSRQRTYRVDWGRSCTTGGAKPGCHARTLMAGVSAAAPDTSLWDRYRTVGEAIVGTIGPVTAVPPSYGDRSRPACRPDQWRLFHPAAGPTATVPSGTSLRVGSSSSPVRRATFGWSCGSRWRSRPAGGCSCPATRRRPSWKATCQRTARWPARTATASS
jgi:hypothetical protein